MKSMKINCIQCEEDFDFSVQEQEKFRQRGFDFPLRCPNCRKKKFRDNEAPERKKFKDKKKHRRTKYDGYLDY